MKNLLLIIAIATAHLSRAQVITIHQYDAGNQQNLALIESGDTIEISTPENQFRFDWHVEFNTTSVSDLKFRIKEFNANNCVSDVFVSNLLPDPNFQTMGWVPSSVDYTTSTYSDIDLQNSELHNYSTSMFSCATNAQYRYIVLIDGVEADSSDLNITSSTLAVDEQNDLIKMNLYPNPGTNILNVEILENTKEYVIRISTLPGQVIYSEEMITAVKIDLNSFQSGIYRVELYEQDVLKQVRALIVNH